MYIMSFVGLFDPTDENHVLWLREVDTAMNQTTSGVKIDIKKVINANPMKVEEKNMMDWAFTHFQLCMKYTQGIFRGGAFVPPSPDTPSK
tara:strand:- start:4016 stop:4285 length:270 start_codon:yes stop_codon:yes gene_type:complete